MILKSIMDTTSPPLDSNKKKKRANLILALSIFVALGGISLGLFLLNFQQVFKPQAAADTFSRCGPSGHCKDYGWKDDKGYTKVPDNCYIALYKCDVSKWNKALAVGCQKNTSDPSKDLADYAEIHKKSSGNPNPKIWDKVVSGTNGKFLKSFEPPRFCGIWQIDVGPPCNFSFHSGGNRRDLICKNKPKKTPTPTNRPKKTPTPTLKVTKTPTTTPTPSSCPVPEAVNNLKVTCPRCR